MDESIQIALALHDKSGDYSRHAGALLTSIFENTKSQVDVHILCDETLTDVNRDRFEELANKYEKNIYFIFMNQDFSELSEGVPSIEWVSQATLYRLLLPDVLPINKVIYLDADMIVNDDIYKLWCEALDGKSIAAVRDVSVTRDQLKKNPFYKNINMNLDDYFNAGMLVMDLEKIRDKYALFEATSSYIVTYKDTSLLDQDALNYVLLGDVKFLPEKYNTLWLDYDRRDVSDTIVWHYAGLYKVWDSIQDKTSKLYWKYLCRSPWGTPENISRYIQLMNPNLYPLEKLIKSQHYTSKKRIILEIVKRIKLVV